MTCAIVFGDGEPWWIKTLPGQGWSIFIRLHGPLESYLDQTWKPDDIVRVD